MHAQVENNKNYDMDTKRLGVLHMKTKDDLRDLAHLLMQIGWCDAIWCFQVFTFWTVGVNVSWWPGSTKKERKKSIMMNKATFWIRKKKTELKTCGFSFNLAFELYTVIYHGVHPLSLSLSLSLSLTKEFFFFFFYNDKEESI